MMESIGTSVCTDAPCQCQICAGSMMTSPGLTSCSALSIPSRPTPESTNTICCNAGPVKYGANAGPLTAAVGSIVARYIDCLSLVGVVYSTFASSVKSWQDQQHAPLC